MPFLLVFNKATDAAETLLLFTVCPGFLEVHSSLSLSCRFSSLGWKHCSRHDLILLSISERDSLFSQRLLEALVREKLEEKSKVWEELEKLFSISGSICLKTGSCSVDIRSIITLIWKDGKKEMLITSLIYMLLYFEGKQRVKIMQSYLPPLPTRLLANPIHLLGIVRVVRQCLNLSLSNSANSEFSYEELVWSKRGCKE